MCPTRSVYFPRRMPHGGGTAFFSWVLSSLEFSDTKVYEPEIRDRLAIAIGVERRHRVAHDLQSFHSQERGSGNDSWTFSRGRQVLRFAARKTISRPPHLRQTARPPLSRNKQTERALGGLVVKAHGPWYHSTLGARAFYFLHR